MLLNCVLLRDWQVSSNPSSEEERWQPEEETKIYPWDTTACQPSCSLAPGFVGSQSPKTEFIWKHSRAAYKPQVKVKFLFKMHLCVSLRLPQVRSHRQWQRRTQNLPTKEARFLGRVPYIPGRPKQYPTKEGSLKEEETPAWPQVRHVSVNLN